MAVMLHEVKDHLQSIDTKDWERLWAMIPVIAQTKQFGKWEGMSCIGTGIQMPYFIAGPVIDDFVALVYELDLLIDYDWANWALGKYAIDYFDFQEEDFDAVALCKLITVILRASRFKEGLIGACFEKGLILRVLEVLKREVQAWE